MDFYASILQKAPTFLEALFNDTTNAKELCSRLFHDINQSHKRSTSSEEIVHNKHFVIRPKIFLGDTNQIILLACKGMYRR
ncbi:hypothetical protein D3C73_1612610 [compost metagenome]